MRISVSNTNFSQPLKESNMEKNETPPETFAPVMMPGLKRRVAYPGEYKMSHYSHYGKRGGDYA